MLLTELKHFAYHTNIKSWVTKAEHYAVAEIEEILHDESHRDPHYFLNKRGSHLHQLASEILTLKLSEVSSRRWSNADFEGHIHSEQITHAIGRIITSIRQIYQNIKAELLVNDVQRHLQHTDKTPTQEPINNPIQTGEHL